MCRKVLLCGLVGQKNSSKRWKRPDIQKRGSWLGSENGRLHCSFRLICNSVRISLSVKICFGLIHDFRGKSMISIGFWDTSLSFIKQALHSIINGIDFFFQFHNTIALDLKKAINAAMNVPSILHN